MLDVDKTCRTCRRWSNGICQAADLTVNSRRLTDDDDDRPVFEIEVSVADDHNLDVELRTGPDFGCILHES